MKKIQHTSSDLFRTAHDYDKKIDDFKKELHTNKIQWKKPNKIDIFSSMDKRLDDALEIRGLQPGVQFAIRRATKIEIEDLYQSISPLRLTNDKERDIKIDNIRSFSDIQNKAGNDISDRHYDFVTVVEDLTRGECISPVILQWKSHPPKILSGEVTLLVCKLLDVQPRVIWLEKPRVNAS